MSLCLITNPLTNHVSLHAGVFEDHSLIVGAPRATSLQALL